MRIGIAGYARSGKDTIAEMLIEMGVVGKRYAFADPIKSMVNALFGWDERHAFGELKEVELDNIEVFESGIETFIQLYLDYGIHEINPEVDSHYIMQDFLGMLGMVPGLCSGDRSEGDPRFIMGKFSPRKAYQLFGTEIGREMIHEDIWVLITPTDNVVVPDIRFPNEHKAFKDNGDIVIKVEREGAEPIRDHVSESYIGELKADITIFNNGTLEELRETLEDIVHRLFPKPTIAPVSDDEFMHRCSKLMEITSTQCGSGNWDYDPYMHGMANGLILALAVVRGDAEVNFRTAPDVWLRDATPNPVIDSMLNQINATSSKQYPDPRENGIDVGVVDYD